MKFRIAILFFVSVAVATEAQLFPHWPSFVIGRALTQSAPSVGEVIEPAFEVASLIVRKEGHPPTVIEWPLRVDIKCGYLTAAAEGQYTLPRDEKWQIGFIQLIVDYEHAFRYSNAWLEYGFTQIPIDDCAPSCAPFYSFTGCTGTGKPERFAVAMNDNVACKTTWKQPAPPRGETTGDDDLRSVEHRCKFVNFLAARRLSDDKLVLLKRFTWIEEYQAVFTMNAPLGDRCRLKETAAEAPKVEEPRPEDLALIEKNHILATKVDPNDVQILKWHPASGGAAVVIPGNWNPYRN